MTEMRTREVVEYFNICKTCGKEFTVPDKGFSQKICYPCMGEAAVEKAKKAMKHLIGAKIVNIEPIQFGANAYTSQLSHIDVKLTNGQCVRFFRSGDEEHAYIDWGTHNNCP